jgi:hypothetical protein
MSQVRVKLTISTLDFTVPQEGVKLPMINPHVGALLDSNGIAVGCKNILTDNVSDDDICLLPNEKADTHEF